MTRRPKGFEGTTPRIGRADGTTPSLFPSPSHAPADLKPVAPTANVWPEAVPPPSIDTPASGPVRTLRRVLEAEPGWSKLAAGDQDRLRTLISGPTNGLSALARGLLGKLLANPRWQTLGDVSQGKVLGLLLGSLWQPQLANRYVGGSRYTVHSRCHTPVGRPLDVGPYDFRGCRAPAHRYSGPDGIEVLVPKDGSAEPGTHLPSLEQVFESLERLPRALRVQIKRVVLNPVRNPDDAYWEKHKKGYLVTNMERLEKSLGELSLTASELDTVRDLLADALGFRRDEQPATREFRSFATGGVAGVITFYPVLDPAVFARLASTMAHEAGHVWAKNVDKADWEARIAAEKIRPSRYAATSTEEDQAELMVLHVATVRSPAHDEFVEIFPRLRLIDDSLRGRA